MNRHSIFQDWKANEKNLKIQVFLVVFRLAQKARQPREKPPRFYAYPIGFVYRCLGELVLGIELPWRTRVGPGLVIYHGYGLVVNDESQIGDSVVLRQGVTIGNKVKGGGTPIIGNCVEFGVYSAVLGAVSVGQNCQIGAGAIVTRDVPENTKVIVPKPEYFDKHDS